MAYDGIFIKAQLKEIENFLIGEHIAKITQKSPKEINFHYKKNSKSYIFTLSANPNFPHLLLCEEIADNYDTPPTFCMLLRKYLQSGIVKSINQIGKNYNKNYDIDIYLERIVKIVVENINEKGDKSDYYLFFEIMGKYSNVIITDNNNMILDILIKDKSKNARLKVKSKYTINNIVNKDEILLENENDFINKIKNSEVLSNINNEKLNLADIITRNYAGLSKSLILSIIKSYIIQSGKKLINDNSIYERINEYINVNNYADFFNYFLKYINNIINQNSYIPVINYKNNKPSDFYLFKLSTFEGEINQYKNTNDCIKNYIKQKYINNNDDEITNIQKVIESLKIKLNKKLDIYEKDLAKCNDFEKFKTRAELISIYGYDNKNIKNGILFCNDYNDNQIEIQLDNSISIAKNVENNYNKYNKLKRTKNNVLKLIDETTKKLEHLNIILDSLSFSNDKNDLYIIKEEILRYFGEANKIQNLNVQKKNILERKNVKNKLNYNIHHYKSDSGIDIYVGKNNLQNEYLTFNLASPNDTWLHIKNATGSHVIIKESYQNLDEKSLIEAASLAAFFSEKRNETKATVDYTLRKELKKVKGKPPGFCIYHKNYSINVKPEILLKEI